MSEHTIRADIQSLRAIAVLFVVAYHFRFPPNDGGFLGVDVFFVISGFLITTSISRDLDTHTFSFVEFYSRRAWRLLPAAFAVIAACICASVFLLTETQLEAFKLQVFGAVLLAANIALWLQTGYFEQAAATKPLLHFWSLGVEEQYYLLLPVVLFFVPRSWRIVCVAIATIISFALCVFLVGTKPGATFYLLPTRAWELGVGSLIALFQMQSYVRKQSRPATRTFTFLQCLALLALFAIVWKPLFKVHPSLDAALVVASTAMLIARPLSWLSDGAFAKVLQPIGDRSYSIYLAHWPVVAFLNSANLGDGDFGWPHTVVGFSVAVVLSMVLYECVEKRFRIRKSPSDNAVTQRYPHASLLVSAVSLCCIVLLVVKMNSSTHDFANRLRGNSGIHESCASEGEPFVARDKCWSSTMPRIALWGDSYAMHWGSGLLAEGGNLAQFTRPTCAPVLGIALSDEKKDSAWGKRCIEFNRRAINEISTSTVEVVLLSALWGYLIDGAHTVDVASQVSINATSRLRFEAQMRFTIDQLRLNGKRVVIMLPPPLQDFDVGRCVERLTLNLFRFGAPSDCQIDAEKARLQRRGMFETMTKLARELDVPVVDPFEALCDASRCATTRGNVVIYRDTGHLSFEGSVYLANKLNLNSRLIRERQGDWPYANTRTGF
jgi:peptidoglycan/LPS O-acetylase OafA/YrhL